MKLRRPFYDVPRLALPRMLLSMTFAGSPSTSVSVASFGKLPSGAEVDLFTLTSTEVEVSIATYGARIVSLRTADRNGVVGDIVLGHNTAADYTRGPNAYLGAVPGRFGNRIAKGQFRLDGKQHQLTLNDGPNLLHGGNEGFDRRVWTAHEVAGGVEMSLISPDGDQGFPGTLTARVRYTLSGSTLRIDYAATTDQPTIVNLTNHAYFNLSGEGSGSILDQVLTLHADRFTPVDGTLIPTGELASVTGTPFDFTKPTRIGERIEQPHEQLQLGKGYDHNWVVRGVSGDLRPAADVYDPATGRTLAVSTTEPGIQFYSGNFLTGELTGKSGAPYVRRSGFCLETQHLPDSPNHPDFPSTVLRPGDTFTSTTEFLFGVRH